MRILYALSYPAGLAGELGGVRRLLDSYRFMANHYGHGIEVDVLCPVDSDRLSSSDLVHLAPAGLEMLRLARLLYARRIPFVVSPILDTLHSDRSVRIVAALDALFRRRLQTHLGAAREICQRASGMCLMSQYEADRVRCGLGVEHPYMQVVHPSILPEKKTDETLFRKAYGGGEFVLFVGEMGSDRKNALRLIQAVERDDLPLVLIGSLENSSYGRRVRKAVQRSQSVKYLGVVTREVLLSAMKACHVFALPSLMEGIGIVAIEAGSLGARVVITEKGAPPEYLGDHAWYVDPKSVDSITSGLQTAWNAAETPPLQHHLRSTLSLEVCAARLIDFYEQILNVAESR